MNGRVYVIASGMLVTATGAALVGVATAAATSSPDRTTAVVQSHDTSKSRVAPTVFPSADSAVRTRADTVAIARWVDAVNAANARRWYQGMTENLNRARAAAAAKPRSSSGGGGDVLACIKHRESRGQYNVVNGSSGAAGAYQFMPGTWNNTARTAGRTDLIGVNPANASSADQDAMARHLMSTQGLGPWGGACG